ncbi:MAG: AAA family ATPase, partial [Actinomycetota bacterium]|nr:AAA family ATPase [Actinomycetota bacterium]
MVPYQPFAEALAQLLRTTAPEELAALTGHLGGELVRLVPEVAEWAPQLPAPAPADPEITRYRMFEAVARTLISLSRRTPVVLVLDDLHWAGQPTWLLLRHILLSVPSAHLLVIGTYRTTEPAGRGAARSLVLELERRQVLSRLELGGLDDAAVGELLLRMSGLQLGGEGMTLARSIRSQTAGNAFLIGEVIRHLVQTGRLLVDDGRYAPCWQAEAADVPAGVVDIVSQRLARLTDRAAQLLTLAAVIGDEYDVGVLRAASGLDEDSVLEGLEEGLLAHLVTELPGPALRHRFTHVLLRDVLYGQLSLARRAQLHRRVGEAIERSFATRQPEHLPELAHHFTNAASAGEAEKALRYSVQAGHRALAQLAYHEAATYYRQALALLDAGSGADDDRHRCDLLLALGEAERRCGAPEHRQTLLEAAQLAQRLGDVERLAAAALSNSRGFWSATRTVDGERVAVLQGALAALDEDDSALRARLLANLAVELVYGADVAETKALSDEALAMARRLGDLPTLASVLAPRYNAIRSDPGTLPERVANTAELLAVAQQLPDPALRCMALGWRAMAALEEADLEEADRCLEDAGRLAAELRQPTMLWYVAYCNASRKQMAGQFDQAQRLSRDALRLGRSAGHPDAELFSFCQQLHFAYERGYLGRHERAIAAGLARSPESTWFLRSWQALLLCQQGRDDEAR